MSSPPLLVLFGSHKGKVDGIERRDEGNLVELIQLKHNIRVHPNDFVRNGNHVNEKFEELYNKNGEEKFVYYVGHGSEDGELCFDEGENFNLENLPPPFPNHDSTIHIRLFMCYQHEAHDALKKFKGQNRQYLVRTVFTCGEQLTQDIKGQINDTTHNYMVGLFSELELPVRSEKTFGRELFGHRNLYDELQKEKKKEKQRSSRSRSPVNQPKQRSSPNHRE